MHCDRCVNAFGEPVPLVEIAVVSNAKSKTICMYQCMRCKRVTYGSADAKARRNEG